MFVFPFMFMYRVYTMNKCIAHEGIELAYIPNYISHKWMCFSIVNRTNNGVRLKFQRCHYHFHWIKQTYLWEGKKLKIADRRFASVNWIFHWNGISTLCCYYVREIFEFVFAPPKQKIFGIIARNHCKWFRLTMIPFNK